MAFDALQASAEAKRRGLGPVAEGQFMMGAAEAHGVHVPRPALKFINRRAEGYEWAKRVLAANTTPTHRPAGREGLPNREERGL